MRNSKVVVSAVLGCLAGLVVGSAGSGQWLRPGTEAALPAAHPLWGLWEVTSVRNVTKGEMQAHRREYHLFSGSHQMVVLSGEGRPKLTKSFSDMTPEEVQGQQPVGAGFYRYTVDGGKIVRTNIAALSAYYEGKSFEGEYEVTADTLVLRDSHSADGDEREWTMRRVE